MARGIRHVIFREDGAVTVFAVLVLSSLMLFFAVLIDFARIAAMEKLTEDAARAGVRSVMSAYDSYLYERYGLFGRGGTEGGEIFAQVLQGNREAKASRGGGYFNLAHMRVEGAEVHLGSVLGEHDVFARQVLEEMKYKAPIDFSMEMIAKFVPLSKALKESSKSVRTLEQLKRLYEQREKHLELVLKMQREAAELVGRSGLSSLLPTDAAAGSDANAAALIEGYSEYILQVQYDSFLEEDEEPTYTAEIAGYKAKVNHVAGRLRQAGDSLRSGHAKLMAEVKNELAKARQINEEMRFLMERAESESPDGYDQVGGSAAAADITEPMLGEQTADELTEIRRSGERLVIETEWFDEYESELDEQSAASASVSGGADYVASRLTAGIEGSVSYSLHSAMKNALAAARDSYFQYEKGYIRPGFILEARSLSLDRDDVKKKLKEQELEAESKWKQARSLLQGMASAPDLDEHVRQFQEAKARYDSNLLFNQQAEAAKEEHRGDMSGDAHAAAARSAGMMDGLFAGMGDMLLQSRDTFYYGEYALSRFTTFDPQQLSELLQNGDASALSEAAGFHSQETEYVLYGLHTPLGNLIAAYGELFAVRLAVRTMEGLIMNRSLGHPLLILSAAIVYGLEKSIEDMHAMVNKGSAPLSRYAKVELTYADYLRLFMLLHGGGHEKRLARMIAVIEQNSGLRLSAVPAGVTGEARMSMKLWFLPGAMSVLGRMQLLEGKVVGNRYETTKTIGWSY